MFASSKTHHFQLLKKAHGKTHFVSRGTDMRGRAVARLRRRRNDRGWAIVRILKSGRARIAI